MLKVGEGGGWAWLDARGEGSGEGGQRGVREVKNPWIYEDLGGWSYEGLPPEVGAFNSQKWVHAPWPVHNFG